jgi:proteasome accessory factor C
VPWLLSQPEGAPITEVCARFDVTREQLLTDLDVVWMVGVYPYTPDTLVDVTVEDDVVSVQLADYFRRPLRMTPEQALAVVATGRSIAAARGVDPDGPLSRALVKVADALGLDPASVEVSLGEAEGDTLELLQQAVDVRRQVRLDYYSYGRDEVTTRVVEPHRVHADQGQWYLEAYCHTSHDERVFRLDRVRAAELLDTEFRSPVTDVSFEGFRPTSDTARVTLDLRRDARWVVDQYPIERVDEIGDGGLRVVMAISARPWLERLLLQLGPAATVVDAPDDLRASGPEAATRVLERYR